VNQYCSFPRARTFINTIGHKADMLSAPPNVRFWGKTDVDQPLVTNLDL
jgi:hypothetical protein